MFSVLGFCTKGGDGDALQGVPGLPGHPAVISEGLVKAFHENQEINNPELAAPRCLVSRGSSRSQVRGTCGGSLPRASLVTLKMALFTPKWLYLHKNSFIYTSAVSL